MVTEHRKSKQWKDIAGNTAVSCLTTEEPCPETVFGHRRPYPILSAWPRIRWIAQHDYYNNGTDFSEGRHEILGATAIVDCGIR